MTYNDKILKSQKQYNDGLVTIDEYIQKQVDICNEYRQQRIFDAVNELLHAVNGQSVKDLLHNCFCDCLDSVNVIFDELVDYADSVKEQQQTVDKIKNATRQLQQDLIQGIAKAFDKTTKQGGNNDF